MRNVVLVLGLMIIAYGQVSAQEWAPEQREIVEAINAYLEAWNDGDAQRIAALCTVDCDRIGARGQKMEGRTAILDHYRTVFATPPPEGVERKLTYEINSVRFIADGVVIVDGAYRVIGIGPVPDQSFEGLNTVVLVKKNGNWLRAAHRNWIPVQPQSQ